MGLPNDQPGLFQLFQDVGNRARTLEAAMLLDFPDGGRPLVVALILFDEGEDHLLAVAWAHNTFV